MDIGWIGFILSLGATGLVGIVLAITRESGWGKVFVVCGGVFLVFFLLKLKEIYEFLT